MFYLREDTNDYRSRVDFKLVDVVDGFTPEPGKVDGDIAELEIQKANGVWGIPAVGDNMTEGDFSWYAVQLNTADTDTIGPIHFHLEVDGCRFIELTGFVLLQQVYDSLFGSDKFDVNVVTMGTDAIRGVCLKADAVTKIQSGLSTATKLLAYVQLLARGDGAIETDNATELTEINANGGSGSGSFSTTNYGLVGAGTGRGVIESAIAGLNDVSNAQVVADVGTALATYDGPTNTEMLAAHTTTDALIEALNNLSSGDIGTALAAYDGPTNTEMIAAFTEIKGATWSSSTDTLEAIRNSQGLGAGAITHTYTVTNTVDGMPIADVTVWVTSDEAGANTIASSTTNQSGVVTFYLDAGVVYIWSHKTGFVFSNPDTEVIA